VISRIEKTEATVLRVLPYSATSHIVTWLAPLHGRLATLVKGATRPRSVFLGQYDLFYTCELLYYPRENGLHIARECTPAAIRGGLRTRWRSCAAAGYAAERLLKASLPGIEMQAAYRLLNTMLDHLASHPPRAALVYWFELRLLEALGSLPDFSRCRLCGRRLDSAGTAALLASSHGLACRGCAAAGGAAGALPVRADLSAMLRDLSAARDPRAAGRVRLTREQAFAFSDAFDVLMDWLGGLPAGERKEVLDCFEA
jgi:DNA repair protein RecO